MKKKTLALLLVIPFILSLLTFVSIKILDNQVASDILGIQWDYGENEGFQIDEENPYELKATPIVDSSLILANGNNLIWKVVNPEKEELGKIENKDDKFYFYALKEGEVEIICQNERGSVSKHFNAILFEDGALVINPKRGGSGENIDKTKYFALYRYEGKEKVRDSFEIVSTSYSPSGKSQENKLVKALNCTYSENRVTPLGKGECSFTLEDPVNHYHATYSFECIDGVNVYSYDDILLACENDGENIVLQTNLESLKNTYQVKDDDSITYTLKKENTSLFGHIKEKKDKASQVQFDFDDEVYTYETTYDSTFIKEYNQKNKLDYPDTLKAGLHLKKNLYGNGFTINMDSLCYPRFGSIDSISGKLVPSKEKDYFFGPLPFVAIGDITSLPLIMALGEDNCGIYIDNDDVLIDDCKIKNCNEQNNFYNYTYTGSVVNVKADNVTIRNSVLSNGKVALRSYSSNNLTIENCILKNSGEFNLLFGSDEKQSYDASKRIQDTIFGNKVDRDFSSFMDTSPSESLDTADGIYNKFLNDTLNSSYDPSFDYEKELLKVQKYLDNTKGMMKDGKTDYAFQISVKDTLFGRSGVFSIASESYFNGPLLYGNMPSVLTDLLSMLGESCISKLGGTSLPTLLNISGDTRFFDYKEIDSIDASSLIEENISSILQSMDMGDKKVTIDDVFPMKKALKEEASKKGYLLKKDGKEYLSTIYAKYGGGENLSDVKFIDSLKYNTLGERMNVSLFDQIKNSSQSGIRNLLVSAVLVTIGNNPFGFLTNDESENPDAIDMVPQLDILKAHARKD